MSSCSGTYQLDRHGTVYKAHSSSFEFIYGLSAEKYIWITGFAKCKLYQNSKAAVIQNKHYPECFVP